MARGRSGHRTRRAVAPFLLTYLRENAFVDTASAAKLLQLPRDAVRGVLDRLAQSGTGILERRGKTKGATYSLNKAVARDLIGKGPTRRREESTRFDFRKWFGRSLRITVRLRRVSAESYWVWEILRQRRLRYPVCRRSGRGLMVFFEKREGLGHCVTCQNRNERMH